MTRFLLLLVLLPSVSFSADYTVTLDGVRFADLARVVYGDILKQSYVLDRELVDAPDTVSVNWIKLSKAQVEGYSLVKSTGTTGTSSWRSRVSDRPPM